MATHSANKNASTHIKDSTVTIDTLNINKTSTHQEIINSLPSYHDIDASLFQNSDTILLPVPASIDHLQHVLFFVDGVSLIKMADSAEVGPGYFLSIDGNYLTIKGYADLHNKIIHGLYTARI